MARDDELAVFRQSLARYIAAVHTLENGQPAYPAAHHLVWIWALENDALGHTLIIAPPAHGKTNVVGVYFPCWWLGRNPERHFVYVQASEEQAVKQSLAVRDTITLNQRYRAIFPWVEADKQRGWAQNAWYLKRPRLDDKDFTFKAVGIGGNLLGARADVLLLDDINDAKNTLTDYSLAKVNDWVATTALSRLTPGGRAIAVQTRWHQDDFAGWCERVGWTIVHMPALSDGPEVWATVRRNGVVVQRIKVHDRGPALWPEFWDVPALEAKRVELGPHRFAAMYQGMPVPSEGAVFQRSWWRFYRPSELPHLLQVVQAYDTAFQTKSSADYSVCVTMGRGIDGHYYVLDLWRDRVDFPALRQMARALYRRFQPQRVYVEERASGQSLIQELRLEGELPVLPYQDRTVDKVTRAHSVTGYVEAGLVRFPEPERAPWVSTMLSELEYFPHGSHDDIVDAFVIALSALVRHAPAPVRSEDIEIGGTVLGNIWQRRF
jgi:predicted phage terminase large subunit-like protein